MREPWNWKCVAVMKPLLGRVTRIPPRGQFPTSSASARALPPPTNQPSAGPRPLPPYRCRLHQTAGCFGEAHSTLQGGLVGLNSFHEKAGECQVYSFIFSLFLFFGSSSLILLFSQLFPLSQAASVATLPSALFGERLSLGASW